MLDFFLPPLVAVVSLLVVSPPETTVEPLAEDELIVPVSGMETVDSSALAAAVAAAASNCWRKGSFGLRPFRRSLYFRRPAGE